MVFIYSSIKESGWGRGEERGWEGEECYFG